MRLIYTSDTHSCLFPTSFCTKETADFGLYRIVGSVTKDDDTVIVDGGDSLHGSALSKYVFDNSIRPFPQAVAFKRMGLDLLTLGNHDFDYGHDALRDFLEQTGARVICANVVDVRGEIAFEEHVVITDRSGLRVGFTGIITDYTSHLEPRDKMKDFLIYDAFEKAKEQLEWLRANCDVSVLVYHGGFEEDLETGMRLVQSRGNDGCRIARLLDYDLILAAHQHIEIPLRKLGNSMIVQLPPNGEKYAEILINGVGSIEGKLNAPDSTATALERENAPLLAEVDRWLDTALGSIERAIPAASQLESLLHGSHIADFFNHVQLEASGADVSCTALGNQLYGFERNLTIRQILASYQYSNTMVVLEVQEEHLRRALEHCAGFYCIEGGRPAISPAFTKPTMQMYNYDYYLGIEYEFDISKPEGQRVSRLLCGGRRIGDRTLRLVLNNFRASGAGGGDAFLNCPVVMELPCSIQDEAVQYLIGHKGRLRWPYAKFGTVGYQTAAVGDKDVFRGCE